MARKKASRGGSNGARDPHPAQGLKELERVLGGELPAAVLLRGEERYFRDRAVRMAVERATAAGMEICRHDPEDPDYSAAKLLDDLATGALFGAERCVVLQSAERVVVERASRYSSGIQKAILARLEQGADGMLVLSASKLRADHAVAKAVKARGCPIVGCRRLYDSPPPWDPDPRKSELAQWCVGRSQELGVKVNANEAVYVVAATGNDLASLDDQLKRLVGRGPEAIQELVAWDASVSPYEVAEHMLVSDLQRATAGLEVLFSGGASQRDGSRVHDVGGIVAQLCTALASKIREAQRAAPVLISGGTPSQAVAEAGIRGPKQATVEFQKRIAARPPEQWAALLEQLGEVERRTRSSVKVDATDFVHLALRWQLMKRDGQRRRGATMGR